MPDRRPSDALSLRYILSADHVSTYTGYLLGSETIEKYWLLTAFLT